MKLPTLYTTRKEGGHQFWIIEVVDNSMRTHSGMVGGKMMSSEWVYSEGKNLGQSNETTPSEQAIREAKSKWKNHVERGYSEDINEAGKTTFFKPMLALKFKDFADKIEYPVFAQPKLDGIRTICRIEGIFSRNGKPLPTLDFVRKELQPVFDKYPDLVIDGEGYADALCSNFNKIISLIKKTKPKPEDVEEAKAFIKYHVYDCYLGGSELFQDRSKFINQELKECPVVSLVPTYIINSKDELDKLYEKFLNDGYEGIMIRLNGVYENRRTASLLKLKPFEDGEWQILTIMEGEGNRKGTVGYMTFVTKDGRSFRSNVKGFFTDGGKKTGLDLRKIWADRESLIGKMATIKYNILSEYGVPRFPYVMSIRDYE